MTKKQDTEKIQCFCIMPISNQAGYEDGHFQLVYEDIIKPCIENAKMEPFRADESKNTNLIQLDILKSVIASPMAICDMSARNPNVFYELGMRQAFDLPTVLIKDDETDAPFDINGLRYVTYQKDMKHRNVLKAKIELTNALEDTYEKRNDKTEINSLIRLLELTSPAKLESTEISEEVRHEKLNELHFKEILANIESLNNKQTDLYRLIKRNDRRSRAERTSGSTLWDIVQESESNQKKEYTEDSLAEYLKRRKKSDD